MNTSDPDRAAAVRSFYGRWATVYDAVARYTPGVARVRRRAVERLDLEGGETVLEVGCGTGANLPYLREAVGPAGRVVGLDLTPGVLARARERERGGGGRRTGDGMADLLLADAADPPVRPESVDAVLATFVTGMFEDPAGAVDGWIDHVVPGGRLALVDLAPSEHPLARPLNLAFAGVTALSTPPTTKLRYERSLPAVLEERVGAARKPMRERLVDVGDGTAVLGYVRVTTGRRPRE